jgi:hypothetical protein
VLYDFDVDVSNAENLEYWKILRGFGFLFCMFVLFIHTTNTLV